MPTTVAKIVDPDNGAGTHYLSLNAFEAGEERDLVAADEIARANCRCSAGSADTTAVTFAGWTTDATRYVEVVGDNASGVWDATKYRLRGTADIIKNAISFTVFEFLQVESTGSFTRCIRTDADTTIEKTLITNNFGSGAAIRVVAGTCKIKNVVMTGVDWGVWKSGGTAFVHNCTLINFSIGFAVSGTTVNNTITQGCTNSYDGAFSGNHNCDDNGDAQMPGANSITATVTFVNAAGGDFRIDDSDTSGAKTGGTDLSSDPNLPVTTDITGAARPLTGVSMGAFQSFAATFKAAWARHSNKIIGLN